ncbi:MAG: signal peptidase I [Chloroflexota bacterium]
MQPPVDAAVQSPQRKFDSRNSGWRWSLALPVTVAVTGILGAALLLIVSLARTIRVTVRGRSMAPLLEEREQVLVDRLAWWWGDPLRGDVALVRGQAGGPGPDMVLKRIVGLPGETVGLSHDQLRINGQLLDLGRPVVGSSPGEWTLGPDQFFLLSENLAVGTDSRHRGPISRADLLGRAWLVYAPSVRRLPRLQHWPER